MCSDVISFPQDRKWIKLYETLLYKKNKEGEMEERINLKKDYENEIFIFRPFYRGECDCGFISEQKKIYSVAHNISCPTKRLEDIMNSFTRFGMDESVFQLILNKEIKKMGLKIRNEWEINEFCTCDWKRSVQIWDLKNDHKENCSIVLPNFYHKKSGFKMYCYNNPLRISIMNQNIEFREFKKIIKDCCISLLNRNKGDQREKNHSGIRVHQKSKKNSNSNWGRY